MQRIGSLVLILMFSLIASLIVAEMGALKVTAKCAECGDGPKDRKCPTGQKCADGKCVKK
jgi:hypothetical protein